MYLESTIKDFIKLLEIKTEEGVTKLVNVCIGTTDYDILVKQIVNNINLLKDINESPSQGKEGPSDMSVHIGETFE